MEYVKVISDGYILGVGEVESGGNISKEEFDEISNIIHNTPTAPDGYYYRLKENLEWELCKIPSDEGGEIASDADYQAALEDLGVNFNA